jgi:hypothetical protein
VSLRQGSTSQHDDGGVSTEVAEPPLSVADATRAQAEAYARLRLQQAAYGRLRRGARQTDITRARSEWGLAILEWIDAGVAEAEDRRDPVMAANRSRQAGSPAASWHGECDRAWRDYQEIRKTGHEAAITAARVAWRAALVDWMQALAARAAAEDEQHVAARLGRLDDADRLHRGDAFPTPPARRVQQLVRESRHRLRQESLRQDRLRDGSGLSGWKQADRLRP